MSDEKALIDPSLIKQVREASGETTGVKMPFIPLITINNKSEDKEAEVDGKMQKVKVPPIKGFNVRVKEGDKYVTKFLGEELEGVVLKERYRISSKWKKNPAPGEKYYSFEFDTWDEPIEVFDSETNKVIVEDPYKELKKEFEINEVDRLGNKKKSFETFLILYLDIDNEVFRFQWKMTSDNHWFDYKKSFGQSDTYVAHKTKFVLNEKKSGDINYYWAEYTRGDSVDLAKEIEIQRGIQQYFNAQIINKARKSEAKKESSLPVIQVEDVTKEIATSDTDEVDVSKIPF